MSKGLGEKIFDWVAYSELFRPIALICTPLLFAAQVTCSILGAHSDDVKEEDIALAINNTQATEFKNFSTADECQEATGQINECSIYFEAVNSGEEIETTNVADTSAPPHHDTLDI